MTAEVKKKISAETRKSKYESFIPLSFSVYRINDFISTCNIDLTVMVYNYGVIGFHLLTDSILFTVQIQGILMKLLLVFFTGFLAPWAYQSAYPPPPNKLGSPDGLPITNPRIKLRDGRHLSYKEFGVPKEELADQLRLGSKFYVVGYSMGGQVTWTCLKYIPHRLAGVTFIAPAINYWWPSLPANLSNEAYSKQFLQDQWCLRVAHYLPWLTYWWNTQRLFPSSSVISHSPAILSRQDIQLVPRFLAGGAVVQGQVRQQGEYESIHRDMNVGFGTWEFDPMEIENPFPNNEGSVHMWMGDEDIFVPVTLQRYIAQQLQWIKYHEVKGAGHLFPYADGISDAILKALLNGKS
ncbi:hypothetical protein L2E82_28161 [Cichorium intybus]|uniref:Uncharacterized protein n=1 Tax=Cichorium intybus TaxID=13427 RepID=A0ACB9CV04_CICIN|nr:hypothetical protein L2E82_28161 [Cichorium intybus]